MRDPKRIDEMLQARPHRTNKPMLEASMLLIKIMRERLDEINFDEVDGCPSMPAMLDGRARCPPGLTCRECWLEYMRGDR